MILSLPPCGLGDALALTAAVREFHKGSAEQVAVLSNPYADVFQGNPHFAGVESAPMCKVVYLDVESHGDIGNIAVSFGIQIGARVIDSTPELWNWKRRDVRDNVTVAIDVGSRAPSRRWSRSSWCGVVERLRESGIDVTRVGRDTCGVDGLHPMPEQPIDGLVDDCHNVLTIHETASVISSCDLFIGMDSGGAHLAAAAGVPQVVIYSRSPWYSRAYWNTTPVFHPEVCPVMCNRVCSNPMRRCLDQISPEAVVDAALLALERFPRR